LEDTFCVDTSRIYATGKSNDMSSILLLTSIWIFKTILYTINSREICCICSCFSSSLYKNIQWKLYDYMWHTDSWFSWNISM